MHFCKSDKEIEAENIDLVLNQSCFDDYFFFFISNDKFQTPYSITHLHCQLKLKARVTHGYTNLSTASINCR